MTFFWSRGASFTEAEGFETNAKGPLQLSGHQPATAFAELMAAKTMRSRVRSSGLLFQISTNENDLLGGSRSDYKVASSTFSIRSGSGT